MAEPYLSAPSRTPTSVSRPGLGGLSQDGLVLVGLGAALSNAVGGTMVQRLGFNASFLGLGAIAIAAFALVWFLIPETLQAAEPEAS